jgi:hypothetical protein
LRVYIGVGKSPHTWHTRGIRVRVGVLLRTHTHMIT